MDEEATPTRVPPASLLMKSGEGNKRSKSPTSLASGGKVVPHYLRASTGSCHEFCKHGKPEERDKRFKDIRPWRKPVTGNGRDSQDSGVKKTVVAKSKPSADHIFILPPSKVTVGSEKLTTCDNIDVATEQASSCSTTSVTGEPYTSDGPETTALSAETAKQESAMALENVIAAAERDPLSGEDIKISEKAFASSPSKPLLRSPSPISARSSTARSVDGGKSMEGRKILDGRKAFEGRKYIDERIKVQGKNTGDERKGFDELNSAVQETTQKCDRHGEKAEPNDEVCMSEDKIKRVEGSQGSPEVDGSVESNSLRFKGHTEGDSLENGKINGKSKLLKKQVAVPKPVILKMRASASLTPVSAKPPSTLHSLSAPTANHFAAKPPSPLHPSSAPSRNHVAAKPPSPLHPSSAPSRNHVAAKPPSPLHPSSAPSRNHVAAKPPSPLHPSSAPSRNHVAAKPPSPLHPSLALTRSPTAAKLSSPLHPSSGTRSKTINNNQVATKLSNSKLEMEKVHTSVVASRSSVSGEEISNTKKVRVIRVVSTIRRQRKVTYVATNEHDYQGLKEDTAEATKITPAKESIVNSNEAVTGGSLRSSTPSVTKSTLRSRISYAPSRLNSPTDPVQKTTTKDVPMSVLRRSKAVDLQSESHRPNTLKAGRVPLIGETARANRRSLKKRTSSGGITIEKSNSGRFLSRRPSARQKKNVQVLFNKVIEETASRLVRTSKSKVLALVGAFETVISIQRKSSAVSTPKSQKKSSSSKTSE